MDLVTRELEKIIAIAGNEQTAVLRCVSERLGVRGVAGKNITQKNDLMFPNLQDTPRIVRHVMVEEKGHFNSARI